LVRFKEGRTSTVRFDIFRCARYDSPMKMDERTFYNQSKYQRIVFSFGFGGLSLSLLIQAMIVGNKQLDSTTFGVMAIAIVSAIVLARYLINRGEFDPWILKSAHDSWVKYHQRRLFYIEQFPFMLVCIAIILSSLQNFGNGWTLVNFFLVFLMIPANVLPIILINRGYFDWWLLKSQG
jgi:hypothetical protein